MWSREYAERGDNSLNIWMTEKTPDMRTPGYDDNANFFVSARHRLKRICSVVDHVPTNVDFLAVGTTLLSNPEGVRFREGYAAAGRTINLLSKMTR